MHKQRNTFMGHVSLIVAVYTIYSGILNEHVGVPVWVSVHLCECVWCVCVCVWCVCVCVFVFVYD